MSDQLIEGTRLVMGTLLLAYAGMSDIRTRRISDLVWLVMGTAGFVLMIWDLLLPDFSWPLLLGIVGAYLALLDMMLPRPEVFGDDGFDAKGAILPVAAWGLLTAAAVWDVRAVLVPLLAGFVIIFTYMLYRFDLISGGADAKALMALALLVPTIPVIDGLTLFQPAEPALRLFPFPFLVFILSGAAYIPSFFYLFFRNAREGAWKFPHMLLGYRMPVEMVPRSFVWPLESLDDRKVRLKPDISAEAFDAGEFAKQGRKLIWVTPQHPGVAYLLLGFLLAFYLGNPFVLIGG